MKEGMVAIMFILAAVATDFPQPVKEIASIMAAATGFMFIVVLVTELTLENIEVARRLARLEKDLNK